MGPWVHGLATNFISNIKMEKNGEKPSGKTDPRFGTPKYLLNGPRDALHQGRQVPRSHPHPKIQLPPATLARSRHHGRTGHRRCTLPLLRPGPRLQCREGTEKSNGKTPKKRSRSGATSALLRVPQDQRGLSLPRRVASIRSEARWQVPHGDLCIARKVQARRIQAVRPGPLGSDASRSQRISSSAKAYIYICGEAKGMAQDVEGILQRFWRRQRGQRRRERRR